MMTDCSLDKTLILAESFLPHMSLGGVVSVDFVAGDVPVQLTIVEPYGMMYAELNADLFAKPLLASGHPEPGPDWIEVDECFAADVRSAIAAVRLPEGSSS
ncbi:MAG: hypothetical protein KKB70_08590 [Proteobacteria bacterium]|nr:hypothetical protein [Pseudomonadota bacterium]MBU1611184.1 hypothetical protein [Pseudomonadota bacterium]